MFIHYIFLLAFLGVSYFISFVKEVFKIFIEREANCGDKLFKLILKAE